MREFGETIFAEMSALATATGSINLGQGFPDEDGPKAMLDAAVEAIRSGGNQYPPGPGVPELREAVAEQRLERYGLSYDPMSEVYVTVGATEGIAASVLALAGPGDEVIVFEPYYDSYAAVIALAGAVRRPVTLRPVEGRTFCPYKGLCDYYDVGAAHRAAWSYPEAYREVDRIGGLVSFEPDRVEVTLDGTSLHLEPGQGVVPHGADRGLDPDEPTDRRGG